MDQLETLSPLDGRYKNKVARLAKIFSERGLISRRIFVEIEYLITLSDQKGINLKKLTIKEKKFLRNLCKVSLGDARRIKQIETKGYKNIPATQHDVKAIEYFLQDKLKRNSLGNAVEYIHFGLTSEDVNSVAQGLMVQEAVSQILIPILRSLSKKLKYMAGRYANIPMLARTHGQPASPTTFGKELNVFVKRLDRQLLQLEKYQSCVTFNGATGNYNAHYAAYPKVNWLKFSTKFITHLSNSKIKLRLNRFTTQREPHDEFAELCDNLRRLNTILIDFSQDVWRYISDGWLVQKRNIGAIGSSTMPHKVNPVQFENAEGNLGTANSLFHYFATKLPISRLQRDLSDSTVRRNIGVAFGHSLIAYKAILEGVEKLEVNGAKMRADLEIAPEVVTEAIQTILRREGVSVSYEMLKEFSRGKNIDEKLLHAFIETLQVSKKVKTELKKITPENYIGIAEHLAGD